MKKKVLIIRSVSFQQLDKNLNAVTPFFEPTPSPPPPANEAGPVNEASKVTYYLLTHGHGTNRALKYPVLTTDTIVDYGSRRNFNVFHLPRKLRKMKFDAVVVPVTNKTGVGFINVFLMTLRLKTKKIYCCNLVSEIWRVSRAKLVGDFLKAGLFTVAALPLTALWVVLLPLLLIPALFRQRSGAGK